MALFWWVCCHLDGKCLFEIKMLDWKCHHDFSNREGPGGGVHILLTRSSLRLFSRHQGLTIKPLVKWLKVPRATNRKPTINEEIHERVTSFSSPFPLLLHLLHAALLINVLSPGLRPHSDCGGGHRRTAGISPLERQVSVPDITAMLQQHQRKLQCFIPVALSELRWEQFDKNYLSKLLLRKSVYRKSELWEAYQKINIRDAISVIDQVGKTIQALLTLSVKKESSQQVLHCHIERVLKRVSFTSIVVLYQ